MSQHWVKRPAALRQKADGQRGWLVNRREIVVSLYVIRSTIGDASVVREHYRWGPGRRDTSTGRAARCRSSAAITASPAGMPAARTVTSCRRQLPAPCPDAIDELPERRRIRHNRPTVIIVTTGSGSVFISATIYRRFGPALYSLDHRHLCQLSSR